MKATRFLALFVLIFLVACGSPKTVLEYKRELSALTMKVGVSGSFFLASGSFGSDPIYVFVETDDSGVSAIKSVSVQNGVYIEDVADGTAPYVEFYRCINDLGSADCEGIEGVPEVLSTKTEYIYSYYVFHIPHGTLATSYDLGFSPPQP